MIKRLCCAILGHRFIKGSRITMVELDGSQKFPICAFCCRCKKYKVV